MSYNIDSVTCLKLEAWMYSQDIRRFLEDDEEGRISLAEGNFLTEISQKSLQKDDVKIKLPNLWWYGEFSGTSYKEVLIKQIAPLIHGEVDAVLTWEGGDSVSGLRIKDGVVEEMDVEYVLVPKKEKKRGV